jgi:peptidoglycan/LPS O-acetylase OafA/YrhL
MRILKVHTTRDLEAAREALRTVIAAKDRATGHVKGDTFWLNLKALGRSSTSVTLFGRIEPDRDGTLVSAWPLPYGAIFLLWLPFLATFVLHDDSDALGMLLLLFMAAMISIVVEIWRGYDLLRQTFKARKLK